MASTNKFAVVIADIAITKPLDYAIPHDMIHLAQPGARVQIPIRGKPQKGYIIQIKQFSEYPSPKNLQQVITDENGIPKELFDLIFWMSKYYCTPLYKVIQTVIPSSLRKVKNKKMQMAIRRKISIEAMKKACIELRGRSPSQANILDVMLKVHKEILATELLEKAKTSRAPLHALVKKELLELISLDYDKSPLGEAEFFKTKPKLLNDDQQNALSAITDSLKDHRFQTHLLHGVTGSGKTEVYFQAIEQTLKMGKSALYLVPEISLTPQTIERFKSRFDDAIAVFHHRLSDGMRLDSWKQCLNGNIRIAIGARSCVFCPLQNIGMIIVDEEHEQSYKQQDEMPCYHARDIAVMRGKLCDATVVLGSATPSIESYNNAKEGKYLLSHLSNSAEAVTPVSFTIVDMQKEFEKKKGWTTFSDALLSGIEKRKKRGEQIILFLNRRGYHTSLFCPSCREAVKCVHCDLSLTYHKEKDILSCHLCGFTHNPPPHQCLNCSSPTLRFKGVGTEQVERALKAIFTDIRTLRVDADTTRHKGSHERLLRSFGSGKADILIGTQMIAKGLHFPEVTLVGILNGDAPLQIPDFRSSENLFQLITQVSGRSGRGILPGEVIIQSLIPDNRVLHFIKNHDFTTFYHEEMETRKNFHYPPFIKMVKILFQSKKKERAQSEAQNLQHFLQKHLSKKAIIHPVTAAGYAKVKDNWRFHFFVRGKSTQPITEKINAYLMQRGRLSSVKVRVDVNPLSTYF